LEDLAANDATPGAGNESRRRGQSRVVCVECFPGGGEWGTIWGRWCFPAAGHVTAKACAAPGVVVSPSEEWPAWLRNDPERPNRFGPRLRPTRRIRRRAACSTEHAGGCLPRATGVRAKRPLKSLFCRSAAERDLGFRHPNGLPNPIKRVFSGPPGPLGSSEFPVQESPAPEAQHAQSVKSAFAPSRRHARWRPCCWPDYGPRAKTATPAPGSGWSSHARRSAQRRPSSWIRSPNCRMSRGSWA